METNFFFPAPDSFHRNCDSHHLASGSGHYFPSPFSEGNFPDIHCKPGGDADHEGTRPGSGQGQDRWGADPQVEAYHASQYSQSKFKIVNSPLQVAGSVSLTWVQPRVLDATQVMISWSLPDVKAFLSSSPLHCDQFHQFSAWIDARQNRWLGVQCRFHGGKNLSSLHWCKKYAYNTPIL